MSNGDGFEQPGSPRAIRGRWRTALPLAALAVFVSLFGAFVLPALRSEPPERLPDLVLSIDEHGDKDCPYRSARSPRL